MNDSAYFEDNNGNDIIEIINNEDGTFTFQVGNSTIYVLRKTDTISNLTEWLKDISLSVEDENIKTIERFFDET